MSKVPVGYGSKMHYFYRMDAGIRTKAGEVSVNATSPMIGFVMTGFNKDASRSLNRLNDRRLEVKIGELYGERYRKKQLMSVPYNITYSLSVFAKQILFL